MVGVYSLEFSRIYNYLFQQDQKAFTIIHSLDGYDEVSLTSDFKIVSNNSEQILTPGSFGMEIVQPEELRSGNTVPEAAKIFVSILEGNGTKTQNNVVIANSALALKLYYNKPEVNECIEMAKDSLMGKKALNAMKNLLA